jgi:hypothetical protein
MSGLGSCPAPAKCILPFGGSAVRLAAADLAVATGAEQAGQPILRDRDCARVALGGGLQQQLRTRSSTSCRTDPGTRP